VTGLCELLEFGPLYIADEAELLAFVEPGGAEEVVEKMQADERRKDACIIGEVFGDSASKVFMKTRIRGYQNRRHVDRGTAASHLLNLTSQNHITLTNHEMFARTYESSRWRIGVMGTK
jgi:hypothetical protein